MISNNRYLIIVNPLICVIRVQKTYNYATKLFQNRLSESVEKQGFFRDQCVWTGRRAGVLPVAVSVHFARIKLR
jgi:hypothetical protein